MESDLNPEAPEFHVNLTRLTREGYVAVNKAVLSSRLYPSSASYQLYKTVHSFKVITDTFAKNVVSQTNKILSADSQNIRLHCHDEDCNMEKVIEANDNWLDRLDLQIEESTGDKSDKDSSGRMSSWNNKPIISVVQMGSIKLMAAKNILRPQLNFKDRIDNSETLWVPKLADKPNNVVPFVLNILYNEKGVAIGYEHPYKYELKIYEPPLEFLQRDEEEIPFPAPTEETYLAYISTEGQIDMLLNHLDTVNEIAVDLEHHSYRSYQGFTCLIQISTSGGDFIIDALAAREHIHKLNIVFTDPTKLKIFHGADMDILWLQRDFGVYVVGMFDTHQAARALRLPGGGLKHLLLKYCQIDADKKYQIADWRIRPLPEELIAYARMDTHYLIYIWRQMKRELLALSNGDPRALVSVFNESRRVCALTYKKPEVTDSSHHSVYVRSKRKFNTRQMAALRVLYKWRDTNARFHDESPGYLLPNHLMIVLADALPRDVQTFSNICNPMPPIVRQNLNTIHSMILTCREMPMEPTLYDMPESLSTMVYDAQLTAEEIHDTSEIIVPSDGYDDVNMDLIHNIMAQYVECHADVDAFEVDWELNNKQPANPQTLENDSGKFYFTSPFDRYKKYRYLAQFEELKKYKEKEAKILAIGKGNELIKTEVLVKMQETNSMKLKEQNEKTLEQKDTKKRPIEIVEGKTERSSVATNKAQSTSKIPTKNNNPEDKETTTSKKHVEASTSNKHAKASTTKKQAEASTSKKPAEASTTKTPAEASTSKKPAEASTSKKQAEASTSKEQAEPTLSKKQAKANKKKIQQINYNNVNYNRFQTETVNQTKKKKNK